ncbi:TIGR01777 family oxidoreductase [Flavobacterium psychrotolerans]|uniref:TIGR01777 family protein n=1 Tax=Flavobacterium psychrotolerans TaxID=2169410 RepID=A0A2U1JL79_9FLAO|nr:TIGR01777 family oxidoreductase [Flavobacterium psychrotolerans]PWA05926.1 TIGR01777 family protein [Flavobacterium psychrotolerans]
MRILITGATGLIGTEIVSLLLQNGVSVHYLTTSKRKIENQLNYKGFFWNPEQGIIDENCLMGVDAIIHLAGASISRRWTKAYKQEIIESRIFSSNALFKALKENPNQVKQIVSASGTAIYPNSSTEIYTEESKAIENDFLGNVVLKWEESVDKFQLLNIKVCKLRTGIVLSNKGGALVEMIKPIKLGLGSPFGDGKQMQSWIHLHDLAAMYFFAIQNSWEGIYNAVAPNPVTNEMLTKTIANLLNKPLFMPNMPEFVMSLLLGEMHELLFTDKNISAQKALGTGFTFQYPRVENALENILV